MESSYFFSKRALVTGGSRGIGYAIVKELVNLGCKVTVIGQNHATLEKLKNELPEVLTCQLDLLEHKAVAETVDKLGDFDFLVNSAGMHIHEPFLETKQESFDKVLGLNTKSVFIVSQVVARRMVARGQRGSIVNISSVGSRFAGACHLAYCASKGAVDSMSRVMALELGPHGIRVNCVNPTVVLTDMGRKTWCAENPETEPLRARIPLGDFIDVQCVADAVIFLLSDKSANTTGTTMVIDGGMSCH